jgi:hypothetical protein
VLLISPGTRILSLNLFRNNCLLNSASLTYNSELQFENSVKSVAVYDNTPYKAQCTKRMRRERVDKLTPQPEVN